MKLVDRRSWTDALALFLAVVFIGGSARRATALEPKELIDGVVARSQAIVSGRLIYTFKSENYRDGVASKPTNFPETTTSISESSWAERVQGSSLVRINHDGYLLEFVQTPQRDGSVRPGAHAAPAASAG